MFGMRRNVKVRFSDKGAHFANMWSHSDDAFLCEDENRWLILPGERKTVDIDSLNGLSVKLLAGRVDVIAHDGDEARLEVANVRGERVRAMLEGGTLYVGHPQTDGRTHMVGSASLFSMLFSGRTKKKPFEEYSADVSILVPRGTRVKVECIYGDTLVSGVEGKTSLDTVSGSLLADGVYGNLKMDTVSGDVIARNQHGDVKVDTVDGHVTLDGDCSKVKMSSVNAAMFLDLYGNPESVTLNAVNGSLKLRLGSDVNAEYRLDAVSNTALINGRRVKMNRSGSAYHDGPQGEPVTKIRVDAVRARLEVIRRNDEACSDACDEACGDASCGASYDAACSEARSKSHVDALSGETARL